MKIAHSLALLALAPSASVQAQIEVSSPGVTTHFSQGWPLSLLERADEIGVKKIRDSMHWPVIEKSPGVYDFTGKNSIHVTRACDLGMTVLLVLEPRNPLYDKKLTAHSPAARVAFANYVRAISDRFAGCVTAIEIGNEINGQAGMTGPAALSRYASHTALLKTVYERVKSSHPNLVILGGSTNVIGTGFLEKLFEAGALQYMDGVAVHPYRPDPEGVDWELERLNAAMKRAGNVKPIWATEFSSDFERPADAASYHLKMMSLMQGAGVTDTYWYALVDQAWFPTMGLLTLRGESKPASRSFAYTAKQLFPLGQARRVDHADPALFHFRYGPTTHVVWGARRSISVDENARFREADGSASLPIDELSNDPVIVEGSNDIRFGQSGIMADSRYSFARKPFTWFARNRAGAQIPLVPIDWKWTSYLGNKAIRQMIVNPSGIGPTGQHSAVVRYTADQSATAFVSVCLNPFNAIANGVTVTVTHNGKQIKSAQVGVSKVKQILQIPVNMQSGDLIDLVIAPKINPATARMSYNFRITRSVNDAAEC